MQVHSKSAKDTHIATRWLPKPVRDRVKSLTNDNGFEFAAHATTAAYLKTDIWFCRPYQTNQSARIEQIKKLVRHYIPKKKVIRFTQPKYLRAVCNIQEHAPYKTRISNAGGSRF
jgi:IS30 family transposase